MNRIICTSMWYGSVAGIYFQIIALHVIFSFLFWWIALHRRWLIIAFLQIKVWPLIIMRGFSYVFATNGGSLHLRYRTCESVFRICFHWKFYALFGFIRRCFFGCSMELFGVLQWFWFWISTTFIRSTHFCLLYLNKWVCITA